MTDADLPEMLRDENSIIRRYVRTLARYERLMEISRTLNSTLNINTLLEQIVRAATDLIETEAASILLLNRSGTLHFEASIDPEGLSLESVEVPLDNSLAGWVVTHGEPLLIADVRQSRAGQARLTTQRPSARATCSPCRCACSDGSSAALKP